MCDESESPLFYKLLSSFLFNPLPGNRMHESHRSSVSNFMYFHEKLNFRPLNNIRDD